MACLGYFSRLANPENLPPFFSFPFLLFYLWSSLPLLFFFIPPVSFPFFFVSFSFSLPPKFQLWGLREYCELPQLGLLQNPNRNQIWSISLKIKAVKLAH